MKRKNLLKAQIRVNGININLFCRKVTGGYTWYATGAGATNQRIDEDPYESLIDAKSGIVTIYPPKRYNMRASWV